VRGTPQSRCLGPVPAGRPALSIGGRVLFALGDAQLQDHLADEPAVGEELDCSIDGVVVLAGEETHQAAANPAMSLGIFELADD
jgi:hypothetical protein